MEDPRGRVLLVPAGAPHRALEMQEPDCWRLAFSVPVLAAGYPVSFLEPFERVRDGASAVVSIPSGRRAYLEGLLRELESVGRGPRGSRRGLDEIQRSLLTLILAEVDRATTAGARLPTGSVVGDALRFIERHGLKRLTLEEVAAALGRSPSYVTTALT